MTPEEVFAKMMTGQSREEPSPVEKLAALADSADGIREVVEGQRQKLVAEGYPESVSWRMAADMWGGIWRGGNG